MVLKYDPEVRHRRSIRLTGFDYAKTGAYFITVCAQNRECLFGDVIEGEMQLNAAGEMIESAWDDLIERFPNMRRDAFVVMPNHIHGIILLFDLDRRGESRIRPHRDGNPGPTDVVGNRRDDGNSGPTRLVRNDKGDHKDRPYGTEDRTVGRILQGFKSITTGEYIRGVRKHGWPSFPGKLWQRGYYDHIIRNEDERRRIGEYIVLNPVRWKDDEENPINQKGGGESPEPTTTLIRP